MRSNDVLKMILADNPDISALSFHNYPSSSLVQSIILDWGGDEQTMFENAMSLKESYRLPFWNGIMISAFNNPNYSTKILESSLRHNPINNLVYIDRDSIDSSLSLSYAFCSKVRMTDGDILHIPQMDFHINPSIDNLRVVNDVCTFLKLGRGWILNSGESYHFIGSSPISWKCLSTILYTAIVFNPIVDTIWISHQLREGCCSLRIGEKYGVFPEVVQQI